MHGPFGLAKGRTGTALPGNWELINLAVLIKLLAESVCNYPEKQGVAWERKDKINHVGPGMIGVLKLPRGV